MKSSCALTTSIALTRWQGPTVPAPRSSSHEQHGRSCESHGWGRKEPRETIVRKLQEARDEKGLIKGTRAQMTFLERSQQLENPSQDRMARIRGHRRIGAPARRAHRTPRKRTLTALTGRATSRRLRCPSTWWTARGDARRDQGEIRTRHVARSMTDEGRRIVESPKKRLLVVAGAGAGKTEAMARRIAWWHAVDGVPKDQIVAFTSPSVPPRR